MKNYGLIIKSTMNDITSIFVDTELENIKRIEKTYKDYLYGNGNTTSEDIGEVILEMSQQGKTWCSEDNNFELKNINYKKYILIVEDKEIEFELVNKITERF